MGAQARALKLRRPDSCTVCGRVLAAGTLGWWDPAKGEVSCLTCHDPIEPNPDELDLGEPGGSIRREYERRKRIREARVRTAHPRIGRLVLALNGEPQDQRAFQLGDLGEKAVAEALEKHTAGSSILILRNRRLPGGRGDIDFVATAASGVYVIDAKAVKGKVRVEKPWFGQPRLRVAGRDRTRFIDGLDRQVAAVRDALGADLSETVPVQGVLCFTEADLPRLKTLTMRGHVLLYRKGLVARVTAPGPLALEGIDRVARRLAIALPRA